LYSKYWICASRRGQRRGARIWLRL
jgi:hypothetical protein